MSSKQSADKKSAVCHAVLQQRKPGCSEQSKLQPLSKPRSGLIIIATCLLHPQVLHAADHRTLSMLLWATVRLPLHPSSSWLSSFLSASETQMPQSSLLSVATQVAALQVRGGGERPKEGGERPKGGGRYQKG